MKGYKTTIAFVANALAVTLVPGVDELVKEHPKEYGIAVTVVGVALRFITTSPIFRRG